MARSMAVVCATVVVLTTACNGCDGGDGGDGSSPDAGSEYVLLEVGVTPDDARAPCPGTNPTDLPVVALERDGVWETFLAPGSRPDQVALDYEVRPRPQVDRVEVLYDFEPRPGEPEPDVELDERCPTAIDAAALFDATDDETVVSARVSAFDEADDDPRVGRLAVSTGTASVTVRTDGLESGDPADADWWWLFEPATGTNRVIVLPADMSRTSFTVDGVPDVNGVLALVQTDLLTWSPGTRTTWAPPGFAANWSTLVSGWHGRLHRRGDANDTVHELSTVAPPGSAPATSAVLDGVIPHDFSSNPRLVLQTVPRESSGTLAVECGAALEIGVWGIATLSVDDGSGPLTLATGDVRTLTPSCDGDDGTLELSATSLVQRAQTIVITRLSEGD